MKQTNPSLSHDTFHCFPASGDEVLNVAPQSLMERINKGDLQNGSERIQRRLSQPIKGASPESVMGVLPSLPPEYVTDFISEPRTGRMEKAMARQIGSDLGGGFVGAAPSPQGPSQKQSLRQSVRNSFKPNPPQ